MNDLQKCQLEILKAFIAVCEKHNLTYYLVGGTALGAVRHKGFIPWDDDIDVGLPREDYEKFIKLQNEFVGTKYFIQTFETDPKYIYNYAKLRDSSTTYIENFYKTFQMNHGVWVDIFPIDGMSMEDVPAEKLAKKVKKNWARVRLPYVWALRRKFSKRTFFKDLAINALAILFFWGNVGHWNNKRTDRINKEIPFDKAVLVGNRFGINYKREAMPREVYGKGVEGVFEGVKVMLPSQTDTYLTLLYHDYMKLPPIEKQVGHHYNSGFSLTEGYEEYIKKHRM